MAFEQIGQFSLKSASLTYATDGTGQANFEGTVEGEDLTGAVLGTLHFVGEPGAKNGTCTWVGSVYLENGEEASSTAEGTWESNGAHIWRIRALLLSLEWAHAAFGRRARARHTGVYRLFDWS